jgi:hypothetical protein
MILARVFRGKFGAEGRFTPSKMTKIVALHSPGFRFWHTLGDEQLGLEAEGIGAELLVEGSLSERSTPLHATPWCARRAAPMGSPNVCQGETSPADR